MENFPSNFWSSLQPQTARLGELLAAIDVFLISGVGLKDLCK